MGWARIEGRKVSEVSFRTDLDITFINKGTRPAVINRVTLWIGRIEVNAPTTCSSDVEGADYEMAAVTVEPGHTVNAKPKLPERLKVDLQEVDTDDPFSFTECLNIRITTPTEAYSKSLVVSRWDFKNAFLEKFDSSRPKDVDTKNFVGHSYK